MLGNDSWLGQFQFLPAPWCDRTVRDESWRVKSVPMHISYYGSWYFFFLLAFASCLTPMILKQHLSLKVFNFYFFKTASKRCKRAYRALLMIFERNKGCSQSRPVYSFSWSFSSHKNQQNATAAVQNVPYQPYHAFPPSQSRISSHNQEKVLCPLNEVPHK